MSEDNSYSSSESWGSRLMGSIKSVFSGFILFLGAFFLIWWNEGRAIKTTLGLEQGSENVVEANNNKVDPDNSGKLVHLFGEVSTDELLKDNDFKFSVNALKLRRTVEMFQWVEKKETKKDKKVGGSEETKTKYSYEREWSNKLIDSDDFDKRKKHRNPESLPFDEYRIQSNEAYIGEYEMPEFLLSGVNNYIPYKLQNIDSLNYNNAKIITEQDNSQLVYIGDGSIKNPEIGDIIISFDIVPIKSEYSIIAQQKGESFTPFKTDHGTTIEIITKGEHSAEEMFLVEDDNNNIMTWLYRFISLLMMYFGIKMVFKPLVVLAEIIPFLGTILNMGVSIFAGVIAIVFSFVTIAIAWVFHRPILGISLLVIALIVAVVFFVKASKNKKQQQSY